MDLLVKRKMVRTAQRLIFAASIAGCSNSTELTEEVAQDASTGPDAAASALDASHVPDASAPDAPLPDASVVADASRADASLDVSTCVAQLVQTRSEYTGDAGVALPPEVAAASQQCCDLVQASIEPDGGVWQEWPEDLNLFCCGDVGGWMGGGSCTPWGPPMPPAMPFFEHGALHGVLA